MRSRRIGGRCVFSNRLRATSTSFSWSSSSVRARPLGQNRHGQGRPRKETQFVAKGLRRGGDVRLVVPTTAPLMCFSRLQPKSATLLLQINSSARHKEIKPQITQMGADEKRGNFFIPFSLVLSAIICE